MDYISTFPSGLAEPVETALKHCLRRVSVEQTLDGLIRYRTSAAVPEIQGLGFLNNTYLLLRHFELVPDGSPNYVIDRLLSDKKLPPVIGDHVRRDERTFRVMVSSKGETVSGKKRLLHKLESLIADHSRLALDPRKSDVEYWVLTRSEECGFFAKRITRRESAKSREKGELNSELANILCWISEPTQRDVFLDPFCGSGAIAIQRKTMPYQAIFASDHDAVKIKQLRRKYASELKRRDNRFHIRCDDAFHLQRYEAGFVNKIVTDPPWGRFKDLDAEPVGYYDNLLRACEPLLAAGGVAVFLVGDHRAFENALERHEQAYQLEKRFSVLVSGQQATIFKLRRIVAPEM